MIGQLLDAVDGCFACVLADTARIVCWAVLGGVASMWAYAFLSPQQRLKELAEETNEARQALSRYEGDFAGAWPLMRASLASSLRRLGLVLSPSLVAGLPMIALLVWLDDRYGCEVPEPGASVSVEVLPHGEAVSWQPADAAQATDDGLWSVNWPTEDRSVRLVDANGNTLLTLPCPAAATTIGRSNWWNLVLNSRAGALPPQSPVEEIRVAYTPREAIAIGPVWARSPIAVFLIVACASSLAVKGVFRIA